MNGFHFFAAAFFQLGVTLLIGPTSLTPGQDLGAAMIAATPLLFVVGGWKR